MPGASRISTEQCHRFGPDAALALTLSLGVARFLSLADQSWFIDEQAGLVTGWMVAHGRVLYQGVFSHHLPFEILAAQLVAFLAGPSVFAARTAAALTWALACLALHLFLRQRYPVSAWTASVFSLLFLCWAPLWRGNLLLVELYWSLALALLVVLWDPLDPGEHPLTAGQAVATGFLGLLTATSSLAAVAPASLVLAALALSGRLRGYWKACLAGAAACGAILLLWSLRHMSWPGLWDDAIQFNFIYYGRFNGFSSVADLYRALLLSNLTHWLGLGPRSWSGIEPLCTLAVAGGCAAVWRRSGWRRSATVAALFFLARFAVEAPGLSDTPLFHASSYYVLCTLTWAAGLSWLLSLRPAWGAAISALLLLGTWPVWRRGPETAAPRERAAVARLVGAVTRPEDVVLALPSYPQLYLDSGRLPGLPYVLYLPWVAAAQESRALNVLRRNPPKLVFLERGSVSQWRWPDYGAPLVEEIFKSYVPYRLDEPYGGRVERRSARPVWEDGLYVLRDFEPEFLRRVQLQGLGSRARAPRVLAVR